MKYFIVAGERSGDLHGSNLIKELLKVDPDAEIKCWGGELMSDAGAELLTHYREIQVMGIWEVIVKLFTIISNLKKCREDILSFKPDAVILVDFGGFNMKLAKYLKKHHVDVHYYILPKIWAWNTSRAKKIKRYVDRLYCILPFEKSFYREYGMEADYVGNPVVDAIRNFTPSADFLDKHNLKTAYIALLPGSRKQEVSKLLPGMLAITENFPNENFIVAGVKNLPDELYASVADKKNAMLIFEENYNILAHAKAAIVTSGTATLETALFEVPQVVVYKTSFLTYLVGKFLIKVDFISLVNLIAGKEVVKELIQHKCNTETLSIELRKVLQEETSLQIKEEYKGMKSTLGNADTSRQTAGLIYKYLSEN